MKIGEEIVMTKDFEVEGFGIKKQVKKGDKAFLDSNSFVHYTTGEMAGSIQPSNIEVKEYDYKNIAKMIYSRLNLAYNLDEFLDDYDISTMDFREEIKDILIDIL